MSASKERVAGWLEMLSKIERALEHTLALAPEAGATPTRARVESVGPLTQLDHRLRVWRACLEQVDRAAARAEGEIDSDLAALREWGAATTQVKEALLSCPPTAHSAASIRG